MYNASAGDTIIVKDGIYVENVDVNKRLTIQSENGSDSTIVQAAKSWDDVFEVTTNYVNISGFTVTGATSGGDAGIHLGTYSFRADHCNISYNNVSGNDYGIYVDYSNYNNVTSNTANNNRHYGIYLYYTSNSTIRGNTANHNDYGIYLFHSTNNTILGNIANNGDYGIYLSRSGSNTLAENLMSNNMRNFRLDGSTNSHFINCFNPQNPDKIHFRF